MPTPETPILDESAVSEIEDRAAKATPPPWHTAKRRPALVVAEDRARVADCHVGIGMAVDEAQFNSEFIAHAREDIPALCATVKHLRADAKLVDEYVAEVKRELGMKPNRHLSITLERYKEKVQSEVRAEMQSQLEQLRAELAQAYADNERLALVLQGIEERETVKQRPETQPRGR